MEIKIPAVGESVTEATLGEWLKQSGDFVSRDEALLVIETDKASVELVAEASGLLEIKVQEGETVPIGTVVGVLDTSAEPGKTLKTETVKKDSPGQEPISQTKSLQDKNTEDSSSQSKNRELPGPENRSTGQVRLDSMENSGKERGEELRYEDFSPSVRKRILEKGIDPGEIRRGTGLEGSSTKENLMNVLMGTPSSGISQTPDKTVGGNPDFVLNSLMGTDLSRKNQTEFFGLAGDQRKNQKAGGVERVKMTTIRKKIAERLVQAQQTAAILTTFNEVDMSAIINLRSQYKESFEKQHGVRLGFMGFFVKASLVALREFPRVNASIEGSDILYKNFYNIGVAVSSPKGLVVPVIKNADQLSLAEIEKSVLDYAVKSREGRITIDEMGEGTFTISNGGVFGSLMSTPILNPPQSGILGMHKIEKRPVVIGDEIKVRPMMYLAFSYDHRMIDGKESVGFLVKIKESIEDPSRMLLNL